MPLLHQSGSWFGRSFDAVKLSYKQPGWQLDAFVSSVVVIRRDSFDQSDLFNGNEVDREQVFSAMRRDLHQLRSYLSDAGLSNA